MPYKDPQKARDNSRKYAQEHREEMKEKTYLWRENNPEKSKEIYRRYSTSEKGKLKSRRYMKKKRLLSYGITENELEQMKKNQNNRCAICGDIIEEFTKNFAIDHNHKTGKVRGLLCMNCNSGLGCFRENKMTMLKAINYLEHDSYDDIGFKECWALENLQPLEASENFSKGDTLPEEYYGID